MKPIVAILSLILFVAAAQPHAVQSQSGRGAANAWWTDRQAGLVGGIAGSVVGVLGGLIGSLAGFGKARRLVLGLTVILTLFGVTCLAAGITAVAMSQPFAVYYPLLLIGLLCTLLFGIGYPAMRKGYALRELRKMEALDA